MACSVRSARFRLVYIGWHPECEMLNVFYTTYLDSLCTDYLGPAWSQPPTTSYLYSSLCESYRKVILPFSAGKSLVGITTPTPALKGDIALILSP